MTPPSIEMLPIARIHHSTNPPENANATASRIATGDYAGPTPIPGRHRTFGRHFPRESVCESKSRFLCLKRQIAGVNAAVVPVPDRPSGRLAWPASGVSGA